jgi:nucleotide-binding universal stress UspA family protein
MYARIICAIGLGSRERAEHLLRASHALLQAGGELTVAHVIERLPMTRGGPDEKALSIMTEAEDKLTAVCKNLSLQVSIDVRTGEAAQTLLTIAEERNAELIVMASHPTDIIDRIFGSTVDGVVRNARCSVLIERISQRDAADRQRWR